jgi:hypothetical protein
VSAQQQPTQDVSADSAEKETPLSRVVGEGFELEAGVEAVYSDNLFHEQRRRENDFGNNAPGERYDGMRGPDDLATELSLGASQKWHAGEHRSAKASIGAGYVLHLKNAIANYFLFEAAAAYDVAKDDRISLDAEFVPRRFKKNYAATEVAGTRLYEHAYYLGLDVAPGWRHKWTKHTRTDLTYELGFRVYEAPFANRNLVSHGVELVGRHAFGRVEPGLGAGAAIGTTPSGIEFGVPVDRSYRDVLFIGVLGVDLPDKWNIDGEVEYRIRSYTTDEPLNETYFDRTDRRWSFDLEVKKQIVSMFAVSAELGFIDNATNRQDHPGVDPEDLGYEEWRVGLGVRATL